MDDVERRVMKDGSAVRFREKHVARGIAALIAGLGVAIGVTGVAAGVAVGASGEPLGGLLLAAVGAALGSALGVLGVSGGVARTVVTERAIHVQAGARFVEIPRASVLRTEVGARTSLYREAHDLALLPIGSPTLTIIYREGDAERRVVVSTRDTDALVRAIEDGARVRVAEEQSARRDAEREGNEDEADPADRARARAPR